MSSWEDYPACGVPIPEPAHQIRMSFPADASEWAKVVGVLFVAAVVSSVTDVAVKMAVQRFRAYKWEHIKQVDPHAKST